MLVMKDRKEILIQPFVSFFCYIYGHLFGLSMEHRLLPLCMSIDYATAATVVLGIAE